MRVSNTVGRERELFVSRNVRFAIYRRHCARQRRDAHDKTAIRLTHNSLSHPTPLLTNELDESIAHPCRRLDSLTPLERVVDNPYDVRRRLAVGYLRIERERGSYS